MKTAGMRIETLSSIHCHPADMKISLILGAQAVSIKNTMIMGTCSRYRRNCQAGS